MVDKIPDYREKQRVLYVESASADEIIECGKACLEVGRITDAIDYFFRAGYREGLEQIRETAILEGDFLEYQYILKALNETPSTADGDRIGENAFDRGKYTFAREAFLMSGNKESLALTEQKLKA